MLAPAPSAGDRVDRYVLLEELGTGGMGVVFLAYDPMLDRKVAVKLLRFKGQPESKGAQRMIREAQALAKLSHPNVVVVHEVGEAHEDVFIAMEHVPGDTMLRWLERPHEWREVVRVFLAAGRGLAAAHSAGLVHRDFKPANVLMGEGAARPRVVDFGLARPPASSTESAAAVPLYAALEPATLTQTGLVVGTPRYMAPEQHGGAPGDAASDQYSFCIALFEALYQQRPFEGETAVELLISKRRGEVRVPQKHRVPARVHSIVLRGLSAHPAQRFASMDELLTQLERAGAARRTNVVAGGLLLFVGASGWLAVAAPPDELCVGGLDRAQAVWNDAARAATADAFGRESPALGPPTMSRVQPVLDAYVVDWSAGHRAACEATMVRHEQSPALMDQRMQCLDGRLRDFRALVGAFTQADPATVRGAAMAAAGLPSVDRCADPAFVGSQVPPPEASVTLEVERLRDAIADARALGQTGHFDRALQTLQSLAPAVATVDYEPLALEHALIRGSLTSQAGDYAEADTLLRDVLVDAHRLGAAHLESAAMLAMLEVLPKLDRTDDALWIARLAEADAERDGDAQRHSAVLLERGSILSFRGSQDDALAALRRALALRTDSGASRLSIGAVHNVLATVYYRAGDVEHAISEQQTALAIAREVMGPRHPHVAASLSNLSVFQGDVGEIEAALSNVEEALSISREISGPKHPSTAAYLDNLSTVYSAAGRHEDALLVLDEVLSIRLSRLDDKSEKVAKTYNNIAAAQFSLGRIDEAIANLRHAVELRTETLGPKHPETILSMSNLGGVLAEAGRLEEAEPLLEGAVAARTEVLGPEHPNVMVTRMNLAKLRLDQGRIEDARVIGDSVVEIAARVLPERHIEWGPIWHAQGLIASAQGRLQDAVDAHERELSSATAAQQAGPIDDARERLAAARAKL